MPVPISNAKMQQMVDKVELVHHGAAANNNSRVVVWIDIHDNNNDDKEEQNDTVTDESTERRVISNDKYCPNTKQVNTVICYASHAILTFKAPRTVTLNNGRTEHVWKTVCTLRTSLCDEEKNLQTRNVITCLAKVQEANADWPVLSSLVCGFSNGAMVLWQQQQPLWKEFIISPDKDRSLSIVDAMWIDQDENDNKNDKPQKHQVLLIVTGSSAGAHGVLCHVPNLFQEHDVDSKQNQLLERRSFSLLETTAVCSIQIQRLPLPGKQLSSSRENKHNILILVGTAAPRNNQIQVYQLRTISSSTTAAAAADADNASVAFLSLFQFSLAGALLGHEDWITGFAWNVFSSTAVSCSSLLASASQDCKIRVWKVITKRVDNDSLPTELFGTVPSGGNSTINTNADHTLDLPIEDDFDDEDDIEDDFVAEGESRLKLFHQTKTNSYVTDVYLEALLLGHEASVTSVCWHPQFFTAEKDNDDDQQQQQQILISSSMDRSILLWSPAFEDGIWTPVSRVGSAGGILGGPLGSSLMGYCQALIHPHHCRTLVGHAFGGALHVWQIVDNASSISTTVANYQTYVKWRASPCITGHFAGVTDVCWEALNGDYLLSVGHDQTCRLWALLHDLNKETLWTEIARPQVHGYNLTAVTSLSRPSRPDVIVTGADEKELRVFDAPLSTLRVLQQVSNVVTSVGEKFAVKRVERAYLPALGLSNKVSAEDAVDLEEMDDDDEENIDNEKDRNNGTSMNVIGLNSIGLPLERDLGAITVWPETLKLYGHMSELYTLASTIQVPGYAPGTSCLVASATKARTVEDAAIRLWNVESGCCTQVLQAHKSTVASLSFSSDGCYLASSGKDRQLCIWKFDCCHPSNLQYTLSWSKVSAHKRIVWSVHFCPFQPTVLASGSRDGCIKVWKIIDISTETTCDTSSSPASLQVILLHTFAPTFYSRDGKPDAVTALSFCPRPLSHDKKVSLLAVGLESGRIELWKVGVDDVDNSDQPEQVLLLNAQFQCHAETITRLAWRPHHTSNSSFQQYEYLASGSLDHGCRIFQVNFTEIE